METNKRGKREVEEGKHMEKSPRYERWKKHGGQLLPWIPNEVTLEHVVPKLSWRDYSALSSVSPGWQQAIQSHEVYDSRVRTHSTETLALIHRFHHDGECGNPWLQGCLDKVLKQNIQMLSLYSREDNVWYDLPPIPFGGGIQSGCQCVSMDGKIYILGGLTHSSDDFVSNMYVLDIAGQRQWKQCASMREPRGHFGVGVKGGKIYVFGGQSVDGPVCGCEMYDPKVDAWFPIQRMIDCRMYHQVAAVGEEFFVYGGQFSTFNPDVLVPYNTYFGVDDALDAYHPVKNEWRRIKPSKIKDHRLKDEVSGWDKVFMARDNFHMMTKHSIYVYDIVEDSWSLLNTFSRVPAGFMTFGRIAAGCIVAVGDELLFADKWSTMAYNVGACLYQSIGFGSMNQEITWEKVQSDLVFEIWPAFLWPVLL